MAIENPLATSKSFLKTVLTNAFNLVDKDSDDIFDESEIHDMSLFYSSSKCENIINFAKINHQFYKMEDYVGDDGRIFEIQPDANDNWLLPISESTGIHIDDLKSNINISFDKEWIGNDRLVKFELNDFSFEKILDNFPSSFTLHVKLLKLFKLDSLKINNLLAEVLFGFDNIGVHFQATVEYLNAQTQMDFTQAIKVHKEYKFASVFVLKVELKEILTLIKNMFIELTGLSGDFITSNKNPITWIQGSSFTLKASCGKYSFQEYYPESFYEYASEKVDDYLIDSREMKVPYVFIQGKIVIDLFKDSENAALKIFNNLFKLSLNMQLMISTESIKGYYGIGDLTLAQFLDALFYSNEYIRDVFDKNPDPKKGENGRFSIGRLEELKLKHYGVFFEFLYKNPHAPILGVITTIEIPVAKDYSIHLQAKLTASTVSIGMELRMIGVWSNPLGFPRLHFGNVLGAALILIVNPLFPTRLALSTEMAIGKDCYTEINGVREYDGEGYCIFSFSYIDLDIEKPSNSCLYARRGALDIQTLINAFASPSKKKDVLSLPVLNEILSLKEFEISICFEDRFLTIGEDKFYIEEGVYLKGGIVAFGNEANFELEFTKEDAELDISIEQPINIIGILEISNYTEENEDPTSGPSMSLQISKEWIRAHLEGQVNFLGNKVGT